MSEGKGQVTASNEDQKMEIVAVEAGTTAQLEAYNVSKESPPFLLHLWSFTTVSFRISYVLHMLLD